LISSGRRTRTILVALILLIIAEGAVTSVCHALVPYWSYTYDRFKDPAPSPIPYVPSRTVDGVSLGVGAFKNPGDLFVDDQLNIYILDTGNNRLVCLDSNWNVRRVITQFDNGGKVDKLNGPRGIYVTPAGHIYIADTSNARVVVLDSEGQLVKVIGPPVSDTEGIIPAGFRYKPIRLAVDRAERVFVVVEGQYEGIVEFDREGIFRGFFGSPRVTPSLADIIWTKIASDEQRERMALFVPTEYSSIDLDSRGFIYGTIAAGDIAKREPIRRLNPSGTSVLRPLGFVPPSGDKAVTYDELTLGKLPSRFVDIVARENEVYSGLDLEKGRVFTYDVDGHLLYVFGAAGDQLGAMTKPTAIDELNGDLLILDAATNRVVVYEPTEYAISIHAALDYYYRGDYENSDRLWRRVLQLNANFDRAYTGIGTTYLMNEQFREAMEYYRLGDDRKGYSDAFRFYRSDVVREHFPVVGSVLVFAVILIFILAKLGVFRAARRRLIKRFEAVDRWCIEQRGGRVRRAWLILKETVRGLNYALHVISHPYDGFWDLKYEKRGNGISATIILLLACSSYVFLRQYTGFIHNLWDPMKLSIYREFVSILVPFGLWCVINWSLTTLLDGKGSVKDIYIASCYAMTPLILFNFPIAIVSNFLTSEEGAFLYVFLAFGVIYTGVLLFLGTMITHHYDGLKTIYTSVLTAVGIIVAIFIGVFFFVLVDQVAMFVGDIVKELTLRM
jgi:hypothetical protein